jgi:hypothetical protein
MDDPKQSCAGVEHVIHNLAAPAPQSSLSEAMAPTDQVIKNLIK